MGTPEDTFPEEEGDDIDEFEDDDIASPSSINDSETATISV